MPIYTISCLQLVYLRITCVYGVTCNWKHALPYIGIMLKFKNLYEFFTYLLTAS